MVYKSKRLKSTPCKPIFDREFDCAAPVYEIEKLIKELKKRLENRKFTAKFLFHCVIKVSFVWGSCLLGGFVGAKVFVGRVSSLLGWMCW